MGKAVPTSAMARTAVGVAPAACSAISEPMLWPTSTARSAPARALARVTQSAIAAMLASGAPALRPWPGRSQASTP